VTAAIATLVNRQPFVNVVITNVPGTPFPLYALGARLLDVIPVVPLGGNLSISIGALSYLDTLTLGVTSDPDTCADVDVLLDGIRRAAGSLGVSVLPEAH
jgi:hypothetical protein